MVLQARQLAATVFKKCVGRHVCKLPQQVWPLLAQCTLCPLCCCTASAGQASRLVFVPWGSLSYTILSRAPAPPPKTTKADSHAAGQLLTQTIAPAKPACRKPQTQLRALQSVCRTQLSSRLRSSTSWSLSHPRRCAACAAASVVFRLCQPAAARQRHCLLLGTALAEKPPPPPPPELEQVMHAQVRRMEAAAAAAVAKALASKVSTLRSWGSASCSLSTLPLRLLWLGIAGTRGMQSTCCRASGGQRAGGLARDAAVAGVCCQQPG